MAKQKTLKILEKTFQAGFGVMPFVILRNPAILEYLKPLYLNLLAYAWYEAQCFPGQKKLAKDLGISVTSVRDQLNKLKELGLLDWKQRGDKKTNIYFICEIPQSLLESFNNRETSKPLKSRIAFGRASEKPLKNGTNPTDYVMILGINGKKKPNLSKNQIEFNRLKSNPDIVRLQQSLLRIMKIPFADGYGGELSEMKICEKFLQESSVEQVEALLHIASQDPFWSTKVTNMQTLYFSRVKIASLLRKSEQVGGFT